MTDEILALFLRFGYASIFVGVVLDNAGFPFPGELVLILTGYLIERGVFAFFPAVAVVVSAAILSDSVWYFAGRSGSKRFIRLYCRLSFGSAGCIERTAHSLTRFGAPSLIYARFVPGFRTFAAPMAGMSGVPYLSFLVFDAIGAALWASVVVGIGIAFAREIPAVLVQIDDAKGLFFAFAATVVMLWILMKWWRRLRHGPARATAVEARTSGVVIADSAISQRNRLGIH